MVHSRRVRQYTATRAILGSDGVTGLLLRYPNHSQISSRFRQSLAMAWLRTVERWRDVCRSDKRAAARASEEVAQTFGDCATRGTGDVGERRVVPSHPLNSRELILRRVWHLFKIAQLLKYGHRVDSGVELSKRTGDCELYCSALKAKRI